jgi:hypothetical protein
MGKILAIVFLVVFVWYAIPLLGRGIWFSPTMYPNDWWGDHPYNYDPQVASDGYGWFNFDPRTGPDSGQTTASVFDSL